MRVGDHEPHTSSTARGQRAGSPSKAALLRLGLTAILRTSRTPSVFTATAIITALATIFPASPHFT
jgi:hypothetical protein